MYKWNGHSFYANLPEKDFFAFRETGYAGNLLKALDRLHPELYQEYDIFLYFKLVNDLSDWQFPKSDKELILFIISHESPTLPEVAIKKAKLVFKQYLDPSLYPQYKHLHRIPVGPSSVFPDMPVVDFHSRRNNVFFSGNLHNGRQKLYKELTGSVFLPFSILHRLRNLVGTDFSHLFPDSIITFSTSFHTGFSPADYSQVLANSKIVLCPYGLTESETMRHFEAMKQGCVIVTDVMPPTFYFKNAPFIVLTNWKNSKKELKLLLEDQNFLLAKHLDTLQWWKNVCAEENVIKYILQQVKK